MFSEDKSIYSKNMKPTLLVLDDWEGRMPSSPAWARVKELVDIVFLQQHFDITALENPGNIRFLVALRERTPLDEKIFSQLPALKLILQTGGHAYHIDAESAKRYGIAIALGRRAKAPLVAVPELVFAMMLGLLHKIPAAQAAMQRGEWPLLTGRTLSKRRLGILGMGRHGSRVAAIAKNAFDMDVVGWDRPGNHQEYKDEHPRLSFDELLETSDVVSIHLRLTAESTGLLDAASIIKMKPGSILINTSRGAIVDEEALTEALRTGKLAGAGLDVFAHEPLAKDSPLRRLNNVLLTPHTGWTVEEVFEEFAQIACDQLLAYLDGTIDKEELLKL
jgi:D-3-phosphoglycerate dehydrogenase / 2-oxoglutarate reductase